MISCPSCGTRYPDGTELCPKDGLRLPSGVAFSSGQIDGVEPDKTVRRAISAPGQPPGPNPWADVGKTQQRDSLAGVKLGDYQVIEQLGEGGMGIVYRGIQPLIGKPVAVKVMRPEFATDPRQVERLIEEARAVNAIRHPGIVDIFNIGTTPDGRQYVVMELLEGRSLEEVLKQSGRLKAFEVLPILEQAMAALEAAHTAGVIHRDLKPSNIFLVDLADQSFLVKLLDFGLAKRGAAGGANTPQTSVNLVVGTPAYMAPEQARGQQVGPRTDLYAMGIVAYELLTGKLPFEGTSAVETMMMQLEASPRPPGELVPEIPASVEALVLRLLAKAPERRPATAADVRREIVRIRKELTAAQTVIAPARGANDTQTMAPVALPPVRSRGIHLEAKATPAASVTPLMNDAQHSPETLRSPVSGRLTPPKTNPELEAPVHDQAPSTTRSKTYREVPAGGASRWPWAVAGIAVVAMGAVALVALSSPKDPPGNGQLLVAPPPVEPRKADPLPPVEPKPPPVIPPVDPPPVKPPTPKPTVKPQPGPTVRTAPPEVKGPLPPTARPRGGPRHTPEEVEARMAKLEERLKALDGKEKRLGLHNLKRNREELGAGASPDEVWENLTKEVEPHLIEPRPP